MLALMFVGIALLQDLPQSQGKDIAKIDADLRTLDLHVSLAARKRLQKLSEQDDSIGQSAIQIIDQFDKESIAWALRAGGSPLDVTGSTNTISLTFADDIAPETFAYLYRTPNKTHIAIVGAAVGDKHIASLSGFAELRQLSLISTSVTGAVFKDVKWPNLVILNLEGSPITDDAICKADFPKLHRLDLQNTNITDDTLCRISMTQLRELYLSGTKVTSAGLTHLERFSELRVLSIDANLFDSTTLRHILRRVPLKRLKLTTDGSNDAALKDLQATAMHNSVEVVLQQSKKLMGDLPPNVRAEERRK